MSVEIAADGVESSEFPVVCETCLGENPYVRMTRVPYGRQCKMCTRPFTLFKWAPGKNLRFKRTEICTTCAKLKNICQACVLDLDLKVSMSVRDKALELADVMPRQNVNREVFMEAVERDMRANDGVPSAVRASGDRDALKRFAESEAFQRSVKPKNEETKDFVRKDIKTLLAVGVEDHVEEEDLKVFFEEFGDIKSVVVSRKKKCAFINFVTRETAEKAMLKVGHFGFSVKECIMELRWAKPKPYNAKPLIQALKAEESKEKPPVKLDVSAIPLPPGASKIVYPSHK